MGVKGRSQELRVVDWVIALKVQVFNQVLDFEVSHAGVFCLQKSFYLRDFDQSGLVFVDLSENLGHSL